MVLILVGWLHVEWDNGSRFLHQFGHDGIKENYDIRVCDEPRYIPENQQIATGCLVRKGNHTRRVNKRIHFFFSTSICQYIFTIVIVPDWQWGNQNGSENSIGTVYRIIPTGEVYVRRQNMTKSNTSKYA